MRLDVVREVFLKELKETLRDRRSLFALFGVPLLLYPLLTLGTAGLVTSTQRRQEQQSRRVAVVRADAAPHLVARIQRPDSGLRLVESADPDVDLARDRVDAVLIVPPRFERDALAAKETRLRVRIDRSRTASGYTQGKIDDLLDGYERWIVGERLRARGMPLSLVRPLKTTVDDVASADRRLGRMLALMLPMILLFTGVLGAFFPAVNATTAERELGTLESLLVTPARKTELLLGKAALVLLSCLLTAGVNLLSMSLVLWRVSTSAARPGTDLALDPGALALAFLAAVPTLVFFAAAAMVIGLLSRNYREANAYATPLMLLPLLPFLVSITEPRTTLALLATPIVNTTVIIRDVLTGPVSPTAFALAFLFSGLWAALMLSLAGRVFTTEQLVNPAWEPLSLKGLRAGAGRGQRRLPTIDEGLVLVALALLLSFYLQPTLVRWGLLPLVAVTEILLFAAPALLFAWLFRYRWTETFSWRRPTIPALAGAALIGVGLVPVMNVVGALQHRVLPLDPRIARAMADAFLPALEKNPILAPALIALLAGVCEELLFRGPLQTALLRRLPPWLALVLGGLLFGVAHMYLFGVLPIALIGIVLGAIVLRTGSIFPAMLLHTVYDAARLGHAAWAIHTQGAARVLAQSGFESVFSGPWLLLLAGGALLLLVGGWLCWGSPRARKRLRALPEES